MPHPTARANGLIHETSPYLLQHAYNPVEWRPWGPGAFAEARRRDVPIFLSIGYSTCYWCHVMERESFEDEATAKLMNERLVCVKVDREERPDVDDAYMAATQALTGRGGWPMSVFLEPETLRPYWAGTYFPREPRHGLPGFHQVIEAMSTAWRQRRGDVVAQAESLAGAVAHQLAGRSEPRVVGEAQVTQGVSALLTVYDRVRGGFGGAPKFPQPTYLGLLMQVRPYAGDEGTKAAIEEAVRHTLDRMATGGIFDQVGGGFHRYSVDAEWLVPHFEKMLYDNAQLALIYAHAGRDFHDEFYARIARRTLDYVLREMTGPERGFFSAQDAEVDGREGLNYLWTREEVMDVLGADDGAFAADVYGLNNGPNFHDPHHPGEPPRNVLRLAARPESMARDRGDEPSALLERIDRVNAKLLEVRAARKQPGTDDKVLAGWNGLMIGAMAEAGAALGDDRFVQAARRAADFVLGTMRGPGGVLLRSYRAGKAKTPAFLEDYAHMAHGLVALHRAAPENGRYLDAAAELIRAAGERFGDGRGGFFDTAEGEGDLFVRPSSTYDGAIPSGQSAMLHAMLDTRAASGRPEFLEAAGRLLVSLSGAIADSPVATSNSTRALMRMLALGGEGLDRLFPPGTPPAAEPAGLPADFTPVVVLASTDRISVAEGRPASFMLRMQIADGYHINAADPGPVATEQGLTPTRVHAAGGTGLAVYADYPDGEPYGAAGELRVYRGLVEMRIAVELSGDWSGRPLLALTYQACTETECLSPATVELDVAVDRG